MNQPLRSWLIVSLFAFILAAICVPSALMPTGEAFQANLNRPASRVVRPTPTPLPRVTQRPRPTPGPISDKSIPKRLPAVPSECLAPLPAKHDVFKTVDLQAPQVKLDPLLDFERVSVGPAITTVKFTEAELKKVGGSRIVEQNGKSFVVKMIKQTWPSPPEPKYIPLDAYVNQLNDYESFLNLQGCTLRQGPLALNKNSPNANSTCCGVLYRLKKQKQINETDMRKQIFFDPGIYERGERFRVYQEERARTLTQGKRSSRGRSLREIELPRGSASGGVRVLDAPMPCVVPQPPIKKAPPAEESNSSSDLAGAMLGANKKTTDKATSLPTLPATPRPPRASAPSTSRASQRESRTSTPRVVSTSRTPIWALRGRVSAPAPRQRTATAFSTPASAWKPTSTAASRITSSVLRTRARYTWTLSCSAFLSLF